MLNSGSDKPAVPKQSSKDLSVWLVGDDTSGFNDMASDFKKEFPAYKDVTVSFAKFGSYEDYEKTLLSVIADGHSPDLFVIQNNGGTLLESKSSAIPSTVVDTQYFTQNFERVFDELQVQEKVTVDGEERTVSGLKGIPLGYETLGVFYNWKILKDVPQTWQDVDKAMSTATFDGYTPLAWGLPSRYVLGLPDLLTVLFLQQGITDYKELKDNRAMDAMKQYYAFSLPAQATVATDSTYGSSSDSTVASGSETDTSSSTSTVPQGDGTGLKELMDTNNLTTVDLFARGKVGMLIGYPSLLREIEYSVKRASSKSELSDKFLRTAPIPQFNRDAKKAANLVKYRYFALSKYAANPNAAMSFLSFLSGKKAQEKYASKYPYYLPAFKALRSKKMDEPLSSTYDRTKYSSFVPDNVEAKGFGKMLGTDYDRYFSTIILE